MMHRGRRWTVAVVDSAEELAEKLTQYSWCVCNGFSVRGREDVVFLNDATCADGAQEYAVCRREADGAWYQVESITMSWCTAEQALGYIRGCLGMAPAPPCDHVAWHTCMPERCAGCGATREELAARDAVVVARSTADLVAALGKPDAPPMHVRVDPRIESREEHVRGGAPMCCA